MQSWDAPGVNRGRRFAEGTAAVAVWVAIGMAFRMSANAYLLAGIPITLLFQRYVRRAPLLAMWVRGAPPVQLGAAGLAIAILLMAAPLIDLVSVVRSHAHWVVAGWLLAAIAGAWAAAYTLRCFRRETFRELLLCAATAGFIGCDMMVALALTQGGSGQPAGAKLLLGVASFLEYIPVIFLLEEVWFRGVLDAHLHHPGETRGIASAVYVSALWGLWHYPVVPYPHRIHELPQVLGELVLVHTAIGVPLSLFWRRSGNLFVPGSVHALIDGVRNALVGLPA